MRIDLGRAPTVINQPHLVTVTLELPYDEAVEVVMRTLGEIDADWTDHLELV